MKNSQILHKIITEGNILTLAFLGDSVHTLFVREKVLQEACLKMDNYHTKASKFCKAATQAKVLHQILPTLTEEEADIIRRARNAKPKHQAKNASSADYAYATAFEALIGYLYLKGEEKRLQEILEISVKGDLL